VQPDGPEVTEEIQRAFDLGRGPLLRVCVWRNAPDEHVIAWTMHHVVTDLATKSLLARELSERYALRKAGVAAPAVPAPSELQYDAFAGLERSWLESDAARVAEDYFAAHLEPLPPPLALAEDRPRPATQSPRGARIEFTLDAALAHRLQRTCETWQVKPFLVLFTAYALLLARYGGAERVAIGVPFTNRRREAVQGTVGCFVNTLPVVLDRTGDPTFAELLRRARTTFLGHHRNQELPLERIISRCRPPRDPGRNLRVDRRHSRALTPASCYGERPHDVCGSQRRNGHAVHRPGAGEGW
jgi:hypothetical protein